MTIEDIKEKILPVLNKYGTKKAGVFGSVVRGETNENSDIDILVDLPDEASLLDIIGLEIELEELLKKKVDILTYDSLYHLLRDRILSEEVAIL